MDAGLLVEIGIALALHAGTAIKYAVSMDRTVKDHSKRLTTIEDESRELFRAVLATVRNEGTDGTSGNIENRWRGHSPRN